MTRAFEIVGAFVAGGVTGLVYFVALWMTVRALPTSTRPALLAFGSYLVRLGVTFATFLLLVRVGGWPWAVSALAGFVLARTVMVRRVRPSGGIPCGGAR
jgi:F1F0 ATPase subunit 2